MIENEINFIIGMLSKEILSFWLIVLGMNLFCISIFLIITQDEKPKDKWLILMCQGIVVIIMELVIYRFLFLPMRAVIILNEIIGGVK